MKYILNVCGCEKALPEKDDINIMIVAAEHTVYTGCIFLFLKKKTVKWTKNTM